MEVGGSRAWAKSGMGLRGLDGVELRGAGDVWCRCWYLFGGSEASVIMVVIVGGYDEKKGLPNLSMNGLRNALYRHDHCGPCQSRVGTIGVDHDQKPMRLSMQGKITDS